MHQIAYSIVIATFERPEELRTTLESVGKQTRRPDAVIVVDSSRNEQTRTVVKDFESSLPIEYERAKKPSAAMQRNQGGWLVQTPLIAFLDDDVVLEPDTMALLCHVFDADIRGCAGGVAARIRGMQHPVPRGLIRAYYRIQAGYIHPTYGGKLFGPAINCLPSYTETDHDLIPAEWLNSTCVVYRTDLWAREQFPEFEEYSFLEDAHLSARIAESHQLFFHRTAMFDHRDVSSPFKRNVRALAKMRMRHRRALARDVLGVPEPELTLKLFLHRLFSSVAVMRRRAPGWTQELIGTWL